MTSREHEIEAIVRRVSANAVTRRQFLAATGFASMAAFIAACSSGAAPSADAIGRAISRRPARPASAAPDLPRRRPRPEPSYATEGALFMYNWADYINPDNIAEYQARYAIDRLDIRHVCVQRGAGDAAPGRRHGPVRHLLPDVRVRAGPGRPGIHREAGLLADPELAVHQPAVQEVLRSRRCPGGVQRLPHGQGLGHDGHRRTAQVRQGGDQDLEGLLRRRPEVQGADRRREVGRRRHDRPAQGARLLAQLDGSDRARQGARAAAAASRRTCSLLDSDHYEDSCDPERRCSA